MLNNSNSDGGPVRHPTLYFSDGDIVFSVRADAEGRPTLLRLHRVMLSHFSATFREILAIPPDPQANELYDGVPVVVMPDSYKEFVAFINAMYTPESLPLHEIETDDNCWGRDLHIPGICALAKKYQVDSILRRIRDRLESTWARGVYGYLAARGAFTARVDYIDSSDDIWERVEHRFPEPALAIRLAMEVGAHSVLRAAFYRLAISNASVDWAEWEGVEGADTLSARWELLEKEDWVRYNRGKDALIERFGELSFHNFGKKKNPAECAKESCKLALKRLEQFHTRQLDLEFARRPDVIGSILDLRKQMGEEDFCWTCHIRIERFFYTFLDKLWDDLPEIFGLEGLKGA